MAEWYGFQVLINDQPGPGLYVGPVPGRKSICLFVIEGSVLTPLAYFRDEESARRALNLIEKLVEGKAG